MTYACGPYRSRTPSPLAWRRPPPLSHRPPRVAASGTPPRVRPTKGTTSAVTCAATPPAPDRHSLSAVACGLRAWDGAYRVRGRIGVPTDDTCIRHAPVAVACAASCSGRSRHMPKKGLVSPSGVPQRCADDGLWVSTAPRGQGMPPHQHHSSLATWPNSTQPPLSTHGCPCRLHGLCCPHGARPGARQRRGSVRTRPPLTAPSLRWPGWRKGACWHLSDTSFARPGARHARYSRVRTRDVPSTEDTRARPRPGLPAPGLARKHPLQLELFGMRALPWATIAPTLSGVGRSPQQRDLWPC